MFLLSDGEAPDSSGLGTVARQVSAIPACEKPALISDGIAFWVAFIQAFWGGEGREVTSVG